MKKLLVFTTLITACLFPFSSASLPSLASISSSRCDLEDIEQIEDDPVRIRSIYVSETNSAIQEVCIDTNNAKLTISELGEMTLLQREPNFEVDYYSSGSRDGQIEQIGDIPFEYYTSGSRVNKIRQIDDLRFKYYTTGIRAGRLRQIGNIPIDYYVSGRDAGKLKRIGRVNFDYDRNSRIESSGTLSDVNLVIVDLVNVANPD